MKKENGKRKIVRIGYQKITIKRKKKRNEKICRRNVWS